ncbi:retrotransposable element Tf2 [Tanacetum coccineum]
MVNSRQLVAPIDDSLKNHIAKAVAATLASLIDDVTKTIEEQVNKSIDAMNQSVKGVCTRQDYLCAEIKKLSSEASTSTTPNHSNNAKVSRMAKIEFPKFSREDPTGWVYRCNQFFKVDAVEEDQKVKLTSMHLYDKAIAWHQQFSKMHGEDVLWKVYVEALLKRFCSTYEDPMNDLKNIKVLKAQAIRFFLGGLDKDIEMSVRMFKPQSLADAYCLSKLQEANNNVSKKYTKALLPTPRYNQHYNSTFAKPKIKESVFYCDHNYVPGHKCSGKLYSLEIIEDIRNYEDENGEQFSEGVFGYEDSVVENKVGKSGVNTFQTMRVKGQINNQPVNILIDCGSTHNFLDIATTKQIGCPVKESYPLQVIVTGGIFFTSNHVCKGLTWKLQRETFQADMMLIPLGGHEMVLGVQWLETLGDIVCNFLKLRMEFIYQGKKVAIKGAPQLALQ